MRIGTTLYKSLSPVQLAQVVSLGWRAFPAMDDDQQIFAPKLHQAYAEMLARQLEMAHFQAGYVVRFTLGNDFLQRFTPVSVAYREHEEYRIPVRSLAELNRAIVGRIELVSGFAVDKPRLSQTAIAIEQFYSYH